MMWVEDSEGEGEGRKKKEELGKERKGAKGGIERGCEIFADRDSNRRCKQQPRCTIPNTC